MKQSALIVFFIFLAGSANSFAEPVEEALQEFLDFATYSEGAITPQQITELGESEFFFVDTRSAEQFGEGHIDGAINIEWREILARRNEIPENRSVVLYCDTGLLSSKAHMALRVVGYDENIKVLFGGYNNWLTQQGPRRQPD